MLDFIGWLFIGLIAGALARFFIPGRQPMTIFMTLILGLIGSLVGGFLSSIIFGYNPGEPMVRASGLIMSTIGAVIVLLIYLQSVKPKSV